MIRYVIQISYVGTNYHGWQVQPNLITVQGSIQDVLTEVFNHPIKLIGSGRTDRGTHAKGQIAHFDSDTNIPTINLHRALNSMLKRDIRIRSVQITSDDFHAQYSAKDKQYSYTICNGFVNDALTEPFVLEYPYSIDHDKLRSAAMLFKGSHDFTNFSYKDPGKNKVRTIYNVSVNISKPYVTIKFRGSGFLHKMVRCCVGAILSCARDKIDEDYIQQLFVRPLQENRKYTTVPAKGLCLETVFYESL
ncbi:tRNA pseudouridine(38-40) synthase TruA [Chlamydiia bacterium]|nr:tRNA pseudouridine(38-40) synthase TruA [Chlamydiia bacterium]